jgi:hypothetical protein
MPPRPLRHRIWVSTTNKHALSQKMNAQSVPALGLRRSNYPHVFKNNQHLTLPWCHPAGAGTLIDYPLESPVWTSGSHSPGPHRVVYRQSTGELCGAWWKFMMLGCITYVLSNRFLDDQVASLMRGPRLSTASKPASTSRKEDIAILRERLFFELQ